MLFHIPSGNLNKPRRSDKSSVNIIHRVQRTAIEGLASKLYEAFGYPEPRLKILSHVTDSSTLLVAAAVQNAEARHTADYLNFESAVTYRQCKGMTV